MRWTITLVAEIEPGQRIEHAIVVVNRDDRITPATLGLSIAEGKAAVAAIQRQSTAFAESAVNQIIATRMIKRQQMRWNRDTVQPFLTVRVAVLNDTLEDAFRTWHASFRPLDSPAASRAA